MSDIRAPEVYLWQHLEREGRRVLNAYGFEEIRTPALEYAALFRRAIGDTTDVVSKEMYSFQDRGGRDVALRPEGTASVMRVVAAAGPEYQDARLYYWGPMFRCERPEAGRRRQFHQLGAEAIGEANPAADAECIALQLQILSAWGLDGHRLEINTMGLPEERETITDGLRSRIRPLIGELCEDCQRRFETNALRILDCKTPRCQEVVQTLPSLTEWMSEASRGYFDEVRAYLEVLDLDAELNPRMVRGLDYYAHTVWEITHPALGAQDALCGGGRYRFGLDSRTIDGVGFAMGIERIIMALQAREIFFTDHAPRTQVFVVTQHPSAFRENLMLAQTLRLRGISCGIDLRGRSFRKQMRAADKARAQWVVIRGEQEMEEGTFVLRDMDEGAQESLEMPGLMERLTAVFSIR
jgi:histidyl-tRNA synthetase